MVLAESEAEIIDTVKQADAVGEPVLMIGGGSNLVVSDTGFDGVVVRDLRSELKLTHDSACGGVSFVATAGMSWDDLVSAAVENEWGGGFESLSGIPGTVGAAPMQNIGAYGQEVASMIASIRVYDRLEQRTKTIFASDMQAGYRTSIFKRSAHDPALSQGRSWGASGRWIILSVEFATRAASLAAPIAYQELADKLGVKLGERPHIRDVRAAVLELRQGKSMVLDDANRNTYSAGSFFTNPLLSAEAADLLPEGAPKFVSGEQIKTSAAWLISHAGFPKGFKVREDANVSLSTAHVLALTNRGGATSAEVFELAAAVQAGVKDRFGVDLVPEPVFVG
ncbi:UDP-N-acetylenolpyruvoylglucosamine reductase domain protein [Gleimia coleocanis DSM 15436]|uniref:UDP-N-acetylenolpyruvoylglucosamine reductase n=2 Tax=Gleimia TaxID=2692113 RepID=C0VYZ0_9ACTO|nr:UDP-N-acetylenolpyruvoylglucosamine reductase domain protein [Gleimia coleocanis DSM 15436]